jgi:hypothetical protein
LAEITWTRESELWLKDIFDYIAVDILAPLPERSALSTKKRSYSEIIRSSAINTNW